MYADAGLLFPFSQGFPPDIAAAGPCHQFFRLPSQDDDLLSRFHMGLTCDDPHMGSLMCTSAVLEYDLGGEGDLFKAPELVIEEPALALDPMSAAMSIISGGDTVTNVEPIQEDPLLSDAFYECKKDLMEKSAIREGFSNTVEIEEVPTAEKVRLVEQGSMQKSVSSGCLDSMEWVNGCTMRPNFLDFQGLNFDGMRRTVSEGDIQTLGNSIANLGNTNTFNSSFEKLSTINDIKAEERREKLLRYRKKKSMRNFGRKIKYACRKALADSQPRVRGRFAKTEECEILKMN